jgi:hypothetical protein
MSYKQSNVDHTLFYKWSVTILIVYVDDIIITWNDKEIDKLK